MKLTDLQTFLRVAECRTFAEAARALRVPKSTVTRRVERLEADLGQALLVRAPRAIRLSEAGRFVHEHACTSMAELESLEHRVREQAGEVTGTLKVTLPTDIASTAEFASRNAATTGGTLSISTASTAVSATPIATVRHATARRFSLATHASARIAAMPSSD